MPYGDTDLVEFFGNQFDVENITASDKGEVTGEREDLNEE